MKSKTKIGWAGLVLSVCLMLAASGCSQLKARDQLNKGVSAYRLGSTRRPSNILSVLSNSTLS